MAKQSLRRIEYMDLDAIKPAKRNPKRHDLAAIKDSYQRFSAHDSPVLDERTKRLLSGHGRIEALMALRDAGEVAPGGIQVKDGKWLVPIQRGGRTKNTAEAEAYLVGANKLTEIGGWDDDILDDVLGSMTDFTGVGFSLPTREDIEKDVVLESFDLESESDEKQFWISVRGPLSMQKDALDILRDHLSEIQGCEVHMGIV